MSINVSHHIQTKGWIRCKCCTEGIKKRRSDDTYANTGPSDARTPFEGAIRPQSYTGFPEYANTVSGYQVMGQSGPVWTSNKASVIQNVILFEAGQAKNLLLNVIASQRLAEILFIQYM